MSSFAGWADWQPLLSICLNHSNLKPYPKSNTIFKKVVLYIELDVYSIFSMFMTLLWFRQVVLGQWVFFCKWKFFSVFSPQGLKKLIWKFFGPLDLAFDTISLIFTIFDDIVEHLSLCFSRQKKQRRRTESILNHG